MGVVASGSADVDAQADRQSSGEANVKAQQGHKVGRLGVRRVAAGSSGGGRRGGVDASDELAGQQTTTDMRFCAVGARQHSPLPSSWLLYLLTTRVIHRESL